LNKSSIEKRTDGYIVKIVEVWGQLALTVLKGAMEVSNEA